MEPAGAGDLWRPGRRHSARAEELAEDLQEADDFDLLFRPESNIVVFRYRPVGWKGRGSARRVQPPDPAEAIIESGRFYFVQTSVENVGALRAVVMNPLTRHARICGG